MACEKRKLSKFLLLSYRLSLAYLACEQALWGTLLAGREKEGELATASLEFEYLH